MKFIHVADMHLDQSFEGLGNIPFSLGEVLSEQNKNVLTNIVDHAIKEEVDFILLVGDTFHHNQVTIHTQSYFIEQIERLKKHEILVILSYGNHDYYQPQRYWFEFPDNVIIFEDRKVATLRVACRDGREVAISGFSYHERWLEESQLADYPARNAQADFHIGFYHGQIGKNKYGSFSVEQALSKGYDYWAMGHIHQPTIVQENPFIVYPGSPIGHTKKEMKSKHFIVADFKGEKAALKWHSYEDVVWEDAELIGTNIESMQELITKAKEEITFSKEHYSLVQLTIVDPDDFLQEILTSIQEKRELLQILQQAIFQMSNEKVWIFDVGLKLTEEPDRGLIDLEPALLEQLVTKYQEEAVFKEVINDLYRQPTSAQLLDVSTEQKERLLEQVKADFIHLFSVKSGEDK